MDGSRLPEIKQNPDELALAARYTPILMCDSHEPFDVVAVGYTIFDAPVDSPSFDRRVDWVEQGYAASCGAVRAIEYALWWDWDTQHLYELEHVWSFLDAAGRLVAAEASWHGYYVPLGTANELTTEGTHPIAYVQPGKHAMVASAAGFELMRDEVIAAAGEKAGEEGLLETPLFLGKLDKTPETDALASQYLRARAFTPTFEFSKRVEITREKLMPWPALRDWIPARVQWWIEQLQQLAQSVQGGQAD